MNTKLLIYPLFWSICFMLIACNSNSTSDANTLMVLLAERDSLKEINSAHIKRLDAIDRLMSTINHAVDSIAQSEGVLFLNVNGENMVSRKDALQNLEDFEMLLKRQQKQIYEMRLRLGEENQEVDGIIAVMKQQLEAKDQMIAQLREQLMKKDVDIANLRKTISIQQNHIAEQDNAIQQLGKVNKNQAKALETQDAVMNECYVIIKTKKELQQLGIIKKGKIVSDITVNNKAFRKIDIRKTKEFAFPAKKPKIISNMPQSSYIMTTIGDKNFTLRITDPTSFWSISNYLIIQTD